jgi:hypothetical protein
MLESHVVRVLAGQLLRGRLASDRSGRQRLKAQTVRAHQPSRREEPFATIAGILVFALIVLIVFLKVIT